MPISRLAVEADVTVLKTKKVADFFTTVQKNPHAFEKHFTKAQAADGAGPNSPQGCFRRAETIYITGKEDFNKKLSEGKKKVVMSLFGANKRADISRWIGAFKMTHDGEVPVQKTYGVDTSAICDVVQGVLGNATLHQNAVEPNSRFIAVAPMPNGFVGRPITDTGVKTTSGLGFAVTIVDAVAATNPQRVTVLPADAAYVAGRVFLVEERWRK